MTYNEGDRWNGREHRPAVNNPQHAARLRCPRCKKPAFLKQGETCCFWCAEAERNEADDNSAARLRPEQF